MSSSPIILVKSYDKQLVIFEQNGELNIKIENRYGYKEDDFYEVDLDKNQAKELYNQIGQFLKLPKVE